MDRLLALVLLSTAAAILAMLFNRWNPKNPTNPEYSVPQKLDRTDFDKPDSPWLIVVFSSKDCAACNSVVDAATSLNNQDVTVQEVPLESAKNLHTRYEIGVIPMLLLADSSGWVQKHLLGPTNLTELQNEFESAKSHFSDDND